MSRLFKEIENKSKTFEGVSESRLLILRPLGPQGPRIGLEIQNAEQYKKLDEEMGKLSGADRKTVLGIQQAANEAGVPIVDK